MREDIHDTYDKGLQNQHRKSKQKHSNTGKRSEQSGLKRRRPIGQKYGKQFLPSLPVKKMQIKSHSEMSWLTFRKNETEAIRQHPGSCQRCEAAETARLCWRELYISQSALGNCRTASKEGKRTPKGGEKEVQERGTYVCPRPILGDIWQRPAKQCEASILQLKINSFFKKVDSSNFTVRYKTYRATYIQAPNSCVE